MNITKTLALSLLSSLGKQVVAKELLCFDSEEKIEGTSYEKYCDLKLDILVHHFNFYALFILLCFFFLYQVNSFLFCK